MPIDNANHVGRRRRIAFRVLATLLSVGLSIMFVGLTVLTIGVWLLDPAYTETNPVVDLGFFALGGLLIGGGFVSQVRAPERHVAGVQQAAIASLCLAAAGLLGNRVEPFVGGLFLFLATIGLAALHPARGSLFLRGARPSASSAAMVALGAIPALVYAASMLDLARHAGPSCFLGQCARGDRFAEMAALAAAIVLIAMLAAMRSVGWRAAGRTCGAAAILVGLAAIMLPDAAGSPGLAPGVMTVAWGIAFIWLTEREAAQASSLG